MSTPYRAAFLGAAALLTAGLAFLVRGSLRAPLTVTPIRVERAAPPSSPRLVETRGGGSRDLARPPGRILLLHFWATWCPPCVDELPGVVAYAREVRKDPGVEVLAVSVDEDWKTVDDWLKKHGAPDLPVALDPRRQTAAAFGTEKFPETYVLSPTGEVLLWIKGPVDWKSPSFRRQLADVRKALEKKGETAAARG